jgi:hypothetical protein
MPKLLKQTTTGTIYVWTERLAERPDMEPYEPPQRAEIPNENTEKASAETTPPEPRPELQDAIEAFRRQVSKGSRKGIKTSAGET